MPSNPNQQPTPPPNVIEPMPYVSPADLAAGAEQRRVALHQRLAAQPKQSLHDLVVADDRTQEHRWRFTDDAIAYDYRRNDGLRYVEIGDPTSGRLTDRDYHVRLNDEISRHAQNWTYRVTPLQEERWRDIANKEVVQPAWAFAKRVGNVALRASIEAWTDESVVVASEVKDKSVDAAKATRDRARELKKNAASKYEDLKRQTKQKVADAKQTVVEAKQKVAEKAKVGQRVIHSVGGAAIRGAMRSTPVGAAAGAMKARRSASSRRSSRPKVNT